MSGLRVIVLTIMLSGWLGLMSQPAVIGVTLPEDAYCNLIDKDGYLWIGTKNGLIRNDGYSNETFRSDRNHPDVFRSNDILTIAENVSKDELWIGTKNGAYILSRHDYSVAELKIVGGYSALTALTDKRISHIASSSDSTMWLCYRNHIFHLRPDCSLIDTYNTSWAGSNRSVIDIVEDQQGNIWSNLWNGGVVRKGKRSDQFSPCVWNDSDYPSELSYDPAHRLIVATSKSGNPHYYYEDGRVAVPPTNKEPSQSLLQPPSLPNLSETILCHHVDGKQILIGTSRNIYSYNTSSQHLDTLLAGSGRVHGICSGSDGTIYFVSNSEGVCSLRNGMKSCLAESHSNSGIAIDGDTILYISSKLGNVYRLPLRKPYHLEDDTIAGNMNGDPVLTLVADQCGRLYILSSDLLKEYSPQSGGCRTLASANANVGSFKDIQLADGGVILTGSDGSQFVGETESLGSEGSICRICVSSYTLDGIHSLTTSDTLSVESRSHSLTLFLTSFTYDQPQSVVFAYRLNGGKWTELSAGDNALTLSPLPYVKTTVEVKARDPYGQWSEPYVVVQIIHPRPWYWWLWIPGLALLLIVAFWFFRRRRMAEKARYAERIRRYEAEKDDLISKLRDAEDKALRQGYIDESSNESATLDALTETDRKLMEESRRLVMENLTNMEYNVDALSSDLCMSRMSLYRKMHGAIGKSPTDFIRDIRLEQASMLLKTTNYSINEISDLTGFSYSSYFTKCFKDKYGKSPKEFRH